MEGTSIITLSADAKDYLTTLFATSIALYMGIEAMIGLVFRCLDKVEKLNEERRALAEQKMDSLFFESEVTSDSASVTEGRGKNQCQ